MAEAQPAEQQPLTLRLAGAHSGSVSLPASATVADLRDEVARALLLSDADAAQLKLLAGGVRLQARAEAGPPEALAYSVVCAQSTT